jgi:hypothetical protein
MRRRLRWDEEERGHKPSAHPYRDTALVYLGFALVIVAVGIATGGGLARSLLGAALFWLAATSYALVVQRRRRRAGGGRGGKGRGRGRLP